MSKQVIDAPRKSVFLLDPEKVTIIGRDTSDGPSHPRYDIRGQNKFDESVVRGMMKFGIRKAVCVVKVPTADGDRLEIYDGRQRVINAREANRRILEAGGMPLRVPVSVDGGTDAKVFALTVLLNEHVITDSPFGRGQKAQKLTEMGYAIEEIAELFRVSVPTVKNYMALLDLPLKIQEMVLNDKIPASKGYELAGKGEKAQTAFLTRLEKGSRSGPPKRAPSRQAMRKIVDNNKDLHPMFLLGLKYALGDIADLKEATQAGESQKGDEPPTAPKQEKRPSKSVNPFH